MADKWTSFGSNGYQKNDTNEDVGRVNGGADGFFYLYSKDKIDGLLNENLILKSEYTATGGETTFTIPDLIGREILSIARGVEFKVVTGTPIGGEVQFNDSTGTFTFSADDPLNELQWVRILSQRTTATTVPSTGTITRTVDSYAEMLAMLAGDNPLFFVEYNIKSDEENGGGTPAKYLHCNNFLNRQVPQEVE